MIGRLEKSGAKVMLLDVIYKSRKLIDPQMVQRIDEDKKRQTDILNKIASGEIKDFTSIPPNLMIDGSVLCRRWIV